MADYQTIETGDLYPRGFKVVARADGSPITAGTVNWYLKALTGGNAGKWWRDSDQTWQASETANAMTHQADGSWSRALAASPWDDGVAYVEYAKESGNLHVPIDRWLKAAYTPSANANHQVNTSDVTGNVNGKVLGGGVGAITGVGASVQVASGGIANTSFAADTGLQTIRSGTCQSGSAVDFIKLDAGASSLQNFYRGNTIRLTGGTGSGQARICTSYNGSAKLASVFPNLDVVPDATTTFAIHDHGQADLVALKNSTIDDLTASNFQLFFLNSSAPSNVTLDYIQAVKTKTDQMVFTVTNRVDATASITLTSQDIQDIADAISAQLPDPLDSVVPGDYASGSAGAALGRIGTGRITTTSIVAQNGDVEVVQGDDYFASDGRGIDWTGASTGVWPDLTNADVTMNINDGQVIIPAWVGTGTTHGFCSVVTPTGVQKVRAEPTSAQLAGLKAGTYDFGVVAVLASGGRATLVSGEIRVVDSETG